MTIRAIDLFCGVGGSSAGARSAGVQIVCAIDAWDMATETYKANFKGAHVLTQDLGRVRLAALRKKIGKVDLLMASPECTNHTPAKGSADRCEKSRETAFHVLRFARAFAPRWLVIENVVSMRRWRRYKTFVKRLEALGYKIGEQVLDAKDFGVPQTRRRLFILGDRKQQPPSIKPSPRTRNRAARDIFDRRRKWDSTALLDGRKADNTVVRYLTGLQIVGPNKPFLLVYYGSDGGGGWQRLDRPLRTVTTVDRFALVTHNSDPAMRMLQVPELQRAMGFPGDYKLNGGSRRERIKLLGNAVCPPVMKTIVSRLTRNCSRRRKRRNGNTRGAVRPRTVSSQ